MKKVTHDVSVLMVNWNTRDITLSSLRSLYEQSHLCSIETILVDNHSSDGSVDAIALSFPQVNLVRESINHGFAKGNNIGSRYADGEFLLLLNTDTIVLDSAVDKLLAFARRTPEAGIWGGRTLFADGSLNATFCWGRITPWSSFCLATGLTTLGRGTRLFDPEGMAHRVGQSEQEVDIVSGCFFLIRADLWRRLGGFDNAFFMYGEEADLCARARALGARPRVDPTATIIHYGGGSAIKRSETLVQLSRARIELGLRHLSPLGGQFARAMTIVGVAWRLLLYRMAQSISQRRGVATKAALWEDVWQRRAEWKDGIVPKPKGR